MCISGLSQQESNSRGGRLARNSRKARAVPSQAAARVRGLLPQNRPRKRSAARSRPLAEGCHSPNGSLQAPPLGCGPLQQSQGSAEHAPQSHNRPRKRSAGLPLRRPAVLTNMRTPRASPRNKARNNHASPSPPLHATTGRVGLLLPPSPHKPAHGSRAPSAMGRKKGAMRRSSPFVAVVPAVRSGNRRSRPPGGA